MPNSGWRWVPDDIVIITFAAGSLGIALYLLLKNPPISPTYVSIFFGIAVAAITYRYLGGTENSQFSIASLRLGGSAALLVGVTWLVAYLVKEERGLMRANELYESQLTTIDTLENQVERLEGSTELSDDQFVQRVAGLSPLDPLVEQLRRALNNPTGAGQEVVNEQAVRIMNNGSVRGAMKYSICPDTYRLIFPDNTRTSENIRITRDDEQGASIAVNVAMAGLISAVHCNSPAAVRSFDMQLSCDASKELFPELVASCDGARPLGPTRENAIQSATAGAFVEPTN